MQAGKGQVRQVQAREGGGGKSKKKMTSKDFLFHHHHPKFYDFFPKAIASFTGRIIVARENNLFAKLKKGCRPRKKLPKRYQTTSHDVKTETFVLRKEGHIHNDISRPRAVG